MIKQFRNFTPFNLVFLLPLAFILCISAFVNIPADLKPSVFESAILNLIGETHLNLISPHINVLITVLITLLQAVYLNKVVNRYNLLGRSTFLPALLYVSMASMFTPFLILSPVLLCNFLLIGMIDKLLSIYFRNDNKIAMFDLGFIVACGSLFYFPFVIMLFVIWIGLLIFKPFNWREWLTGLVGFLCVYGILFILYFWLDLLPEFYKIWFPITNPVFTSTLSFDFHDYLALIIPCVIMVLFVFSLQQSFYKRIVLIRKAFILLFFIFILGLISFYLAPTYQEYHFLLCIPSIAIYMAYYFNYAQKRWIYESLFILMIFGFLYFQWF